MSVKISVAQKEVLRQAVRLAYNETLSIEPDEMMTRNGFGSVWLIGWESGHATTPGAETFADWITTACKMADLLDSYDVEVDPTMPYSLDGEHEVTVDEVDALAEEVAEMIEAGRTSRAVHSVLEGKAVAF